MKFKKIISMILCCVMLMSLTVINVSAATSGKCGSSAYWSYNTSTKTLTISGTGNMYNYDFTDWNNLTPWDSYMSQIKKVVVNDGITSIGKYSFGGFSYNLTEVELPDSIITIKANAFTGASISEINIGSKVKTNEENAFLGTVLSDVYYNGTLSQWNNISIEETGNSLLLEATLHYIALKDFTGVTFSNKSTDTYDGAEKSISVSGAPSGATVTYTSDDTTENNATNAGTYNIKATISKEGYNDLILNATLTINKKDLTVSGLVAKNKPYDATTNAEIDTTSGILVGVVNGDDVTPTFPTTGAFASVNAGNNITVSFSPVTISGADKDNYNIIQPTLKANITKLPIKIEADDKEVVKGGTLPELTYTISEDTKNNFVGNDKESGTLATNANVNTVGNYDITQGTLSVPANYELTFTKGTLSVIDKTPQNIVLSEIPTTKIYGDAGFTVAVESDTTPQLGDVSYTSSNTDVATIDSDDNVVIKNAGTTTISVSRDGDDTYAPFTRTQVLTVNKIPVTVTANNAQKRVNTADPAELTYTYTGMIISGDDFTGKLERANGETVGEYDINQGTLTLGDNYDITFVKGTFEILEKNPQTITLDDIPNKTYGEADFNLVVTKDSTSNLENFTYASSNENVATVDTTGKVTIKGAGETEISVTEAGNEDYAQTTVKKTLTVAKAPLNIKLDNISITYGDTMPDYTITYTGFIGEENKSVLTAEPQVNGMPKKANAGEYDLTLSGAEAANYEITYENAKLTVAKKTLSVATMNVFDKAADETTTATINTSSITFTGLVNGDDVKIDTSVATATFDDATVGNNKAVSISNIAIIGNDANNYELSDTTFATTGNIKDSITATDIAAQISAPLVEKNAETLTLPEVPEGYEIVIKSSDDEAVIGLDGKIAPTTEDKTVKLVFTVKNTADETDTADTAELTVTVPTSDKVNVTVTAEANGTVAGGGEYPKNSEVTVTATANSGYNFSGWYNGETSVSTSASYTFKATDDVSLIAKFTRRSSGGGGGGRVSSYTVKFDTDGGNEIKSVKVSRNKTVAEPTAPTKEGYTFDGWYTDKDLTEKYDFESKVTKSFTLYAKWVENKTEEQPDETDKPETPDTEAMPFTDVDTNDWYYETVKTAYEKGLMNGVSNTEFGADTNVTRGMFVTVLYRMENEPVAPKLNFIDVESGAYYTDAIAWANANNIVAGVTDTEFAPNDNITREQMATILFRYATYKGMDTVTLAENLGQFTDNAEISEYAISALNWAVGNNVMSGKGNGILDPKGLATRAEAAAVLVRMAK